MKINIFIKNTVVLVATSFILRTVGVFFRVYIADQIGSEGVGLYQLIFSVYILASTFASAGISTAVTRLVADNFHRGKQAVTSVMRAAVLITVAVALVSTAAVFFGAKPISVYLLKDIRAVPSLKILSFSLPFMGLSSVARGYFIACRKTIQPSAVQLLEQAVRIGVVMVLLSTFAHKGLEFCAAAVLMGDTVAETVSFFVNWALYIKDVRRQKNGERVEGVFKEIWRIALPISGVGYMSSVLQTVESLLVPLRLSLFHGTRERSLELFGAIRGMALPVLFFPASFLTALSTMLIPEVSCAAAQNDHRKIKETVSFSVGTTLIISNFIAISFMFNAVDIGQIVYNDRDVGQIIAVLSPIIPFMYLESVVAGILKGLDCQMNMLRYNLADSVIRIAAVLLLLPMWGIKGYLGVMIVSNIFTSTMAVVCLFKTSGVKPKLSEWLLKPIFVSVAGGVVGVWVASFVNTVALRLLISIGIQTAVFATWLFTKKHKNTSNINAYTI